MNTLASNPCASRILLVDDDAEVRHAMQRALSQSGMSVVEVGSGDTAAQMIAESVSFNMLVTDVCMPGRRDGVALASDWRKKVPGRPILFVSGFSEMQVDAAALGPHEAVLLKPFPRACFVGTVRTLLAGTSQAAA